MSKVLKPVVVATLAAACKYKKASWSFAVGPRTSAPQKPLARRFATSAEERLSAAERRFASLRLSSNLEEILGRVPASKPLKQPRLLGAVLVVRLGLNFFTLGKQCHSHGLPWSGCATSFLPWAEFIIYLAMVLSGLYGLCVCICLDASLPYMPANNARWRRAAVGAVQLRQAAGFSALKLLDSFRTAPPEILAVWEKYSARYSSKLTAMQKGVMSLIGKTILELAKATLGLLAFSAKLQTFDKSWIALLGLANQVTHLVEIQDVEKDAVEKFVFTGEDAKWSDSESEALREFNGRTLKLCVRASGNHALGIAAFAALEASDLQKLVISERKEPPAE